jgi:two-component system alkaline phosphatase synthesis response regulator PhoP
MAKKVLVVEDEESLAKILKFDLETVGFLVKIARDGQEAYRFAQKERFDCFIIDWMLPILNGVDLIKKLRAEKQQALIIMLTAKSSEFDAIEGLTSGADLYLKKPISNRELIAQMKALFGLIKVDNQDDKEVIVLGNITIKPNQYILLLNNQEIPLTKMEFDLFKFMVINKNQAISRDTILNSIWGFNYDGTTRIVDVHIYNLKKKLAAASCDFKSVRGVGYNLVVK